MNQLFLIAALVFASPHASEADGFDQVLDRRADPCVDFYQFACGGWLAAHPIPAESASWSLYSEIEQNNLERVHGILERAASAPADAPLVEREVGAYYVACMDDDAVDAAGLAPLRTELRTIDSITRAAEIAPALARLWSHGIEAPIAMGPDADADDATKVIAEAFPPRLPLRLKDNYLSDDAHAQNIRNEYLAHLRRVFALIGEDKVAAAADADRVLSFESALAKATRNAKEKRDPKARHNLLSLGKTSAHEIDWQRFLRQIAGPKVSSINVTEPAYFAAVARLMESADAATWRAYLSAQLIHAMSDVLPQKLAAEDFDFFSHTLAGVAAPKPRWKRCADLVDRDLGEAMGQLFVREAFSESSKQRVRTIFERVRKSLATSISQASWLTQQGRDEALAILSLQRVKIGYPDHWRDYSALHIDRHDAFGNAQRAMAFEQRYELGKIGQPVNGDEWHELPQSLDAYGIDSRNEVAFTAGFLQPPIFSAAADDATVFGALGAVMGHELSHRFDDEGRHFDRHGNLHDWWSGDDAKGYEERAACFANQYEKYPVGASHLDGKLTLGENIADNGGLRVAYRAAVSGGDSKTPSGFTAAQRVFLSWASIRCANVSAQAERTRLGSDPHSTGRYRVIGVLSNMEEFARAFSCPASSPMVNAPTCRLW